MKTMVGYRTCRRCKREWEATAENFYRVKWGDGLMRVCKGCQNKAVLADRARAILDGSYAQYHREYRLRKRLLCQGQ